MSGSDYADVRRLECRNLECQCTNGFYSVHLIFLASLTGNRSCNLRVAQLEIARSMRESKMTRWFWRSRSTMPNGRTECCRPENWKRWTWREANYCYYHCQSSGTNTTGKIVLRNSIEIHRMYAANYTHFAYRSDTLFPLFHINANFTDGSVTVRIVVRKYDCTLRKHCFRLESTPRIRHISLPYILWTNNLFGFARAFFTWIRILYRIRTIRQKIDTLRPDGLCSHVSQQDVSAEIITQTQQPTPKPS